MPSSKEKAKVPKAMGCQLLSKRLSSGSGALYSIVYVTTNTTDHVLF